MKDIIEMLNGLSVAFTDFVDSEKEMLQLRIEEIELMKEAYERPS